jgi:ribosomal protein S21
LLGDCAATEERVDIRKRSVRKEGMLKEARARILQEAEDRKRGKREEEEEEGQYGRDGEEREQGE